MSPATDTETSKRVERTITSRSQLSAGGPRPPFPAKLILLQEESSEYGNQIALQLERCDEIWEDTQKPSVTYRWLSLTGSDGEPIWEGSDTDQVATSFEEVTGVDFFAPESEELVGTFFMVEDVDTGRKNKKDKAIYMTLFRENLGTEYKYEGKIRVRPSQNTSPTNDAAPEMDEHDVASYLASRFDGIAIAELKGGTALNLVKSDETLADVRTLFGKTLRGGLVQPAAVLIGMLIEQGYASDEAGVFFANPDDLL